MKINEVIHVCHELDMLEAHIVEAQQYANRIIIKESPVYWSGKKKPLYVSENWSRFDKYKKVEIMVIPPEQYNLNLPEVSSPEEFKAHLLIHRLNRDATRYYGWKDVSRDCDYVIECDVDEIIDRNRFHHLYDVLASDYYQHVVVTYENYIQYMNRKTKKHQEYRVFGAKEPEMVLWPKGRKRTVCSKYVGWHFSNCFFPEGLYEKAISGCHEYGWHGVGSVQDFDIFKHAFDNKKDWRGKDVPLEGEVINIDMNNYPLFVQSNKELFPWE